MKWRPEVEIAIVDGDGDASCFQRKAVGHLKLVAGPDLGIPVVEGKGRTLD